MKKTAERRARSVATLKAQGGDDITFSCDSCMHADGCPSAFDLECEAPVCIEGRMFTFNAGGGAGIELRDIGDGLWELLDQGGGRALTPPMFVTDLIRLADMLVKPVSVDPSDFSDEERHEAELFRARGLAFVKGHRAGMAFQQSNGWQDECERWRLLHARLMVLLDMGASTNDISAAIASYSPLNQPGDGVSNG